MKVKIVKASRDSFWYSRRIGDVFEVMMREDGESYQVIRDNVISYRYIDKSDCEIVEESAPLGESNHPDAKRSNPKDVAASTRLDISLCPMSGIIYEALAMTEGDLKYGAFNYRIAGVNASVYVAAAMRHLFKWYNGEWADKKTKVPHLGSAKACIGVLIDAYEKGILHDDRPPVENIPKLLEDCEEIIKHLHSVFPPEKSPGRYTEAEHGDK